MNGRAIHFVAKLIHRRQTLGDCYAKTTLGWLSLQDWQTLR